jgi:hypothetical protein
VDTAKHASPSGASDQTGPVGTSNATESARPQAYPVTATAREAKVRRRRAAQTRWRARRAPRSERWGSPSQALATAFATVAAAPSAYNA